VVNDKENQHDDKGDQIADRKKHQNLLVGDYNRLQYKVYSVDVKGYVRREILFFLIIFTALRSVAAQTIIAPRDISPGDPFLCWMTSARPILSASAYLQDSAGKKLASAKPFFMPSVENEFLYGFLFPIPVKTSPGAGELLVSVVFEENGGGQSIAELHRPFNIVAKKFFREDIPLDKSNSLLRTKPDPAKTAESIAFAKIFETRDLTTLYAAGPMEKPLSVTWRETAGFADERRYIYYDGSSDSTLHGGIDLGAKEGSEVVACAGGRVAFAGPRIVTGNTIVLEHLPGLFSIYMHLSAIGVHEGDIVDEGQPIGRVGSTGLSTGPHLHWELRIGEVSVNPYYWLSHSLLDKDANSGKIKLPAEGR
jgi:murein DD-endopeptidase MepM/ murein hydrolase activator NlpD